MRIIIVNGSPRRKGLTAAFLHAIEKRLVSRGAEVVFYHIADLDIQPCAGCCTCYRSGQCIYDDDGERLSREIADADGIVIGSPTYASNVSGQLKIFIDRGHFVIEQLLRGKYAVTVATGENYGSRDTSAVLGRLVSYSGAYISRRIVHNAPFGSEEVDVKKAVRAADRLYDDIKRKRNYPVQSIKHAVVFGAGIRPFVKRKGELYRGVVNKWAASGVTAK